MLCKCLVGEDSKPVLCIEWFSISLQSPKFFIHYLFYNLGLYIIFIAFFIVYGTNERRVPKAQETQLRCCPLIITYTRTCTRSRTNSRTNARELASLLEHTQVRTHERILVNVNTYKFFEPDLRVETWFSPKIKMKINSFPRNK